MKFHFVLKISNILEKPDRWILGWNGMVTILYGGLIDPLRLPHKSQEPTFMSPVDNFEFPLSFFSKAFLISGKRRQIKLIGFPALQLLDYWMS